MRVTIAVDDISLPLPPMAPPDVRQTIIEIVLELLDANGVDDVHIIIANSLHRRMTEAEMRRMVGEKIHDAFYPDRYYNHDAEDPDGIVHARAAPTTARWSSSTAARVESDLVIYVNINLVPDGRRPQVGGGRPVRLREPAAAPRAEDDARLATATWTRSSRRCNTKVERMGALVDKHLNVFHIETALNNRMFAGPTAFLSKNEDDFTEVDRLKFEAHAAGRCRKLPRGGEAEAVPRDPGAVPADRRATPARPSRCTRRRSSAASSSTRSPCAGQADILICGVPFICPTT